jgi:hypothetical protein
MLVEIVFAFLLSLLEVAKLELVSHEWAFFTSLMLEIFDDLPTVMLLEDAHVTLIVPHAALLSLLRNVNLVLGRL